MADGEMTPKAIHVVLTRIVLRQDEMEARFARIEAALGIGPMQPLPPPPPPLPVPPPPLPAQQLSLELPREAVDVATAASPALAAAPAAASPPLAYPPPAYAPPAYAPPPQQQPTQPQPPRDAALESRVGLQWLNRIGVITLILGVGFAFKTASDNDWIGPSARVGLGALAALIALVVGDRAWARKHTVFAQGLIGLGLAILYLVWWASFSLYDLVPQPLVFALMVATTIGSALLSVRYASQAIAMLALIGGFVTPVVLSSGEPHPVIFLGYLVLLDAGALALARQRSWWALELLAATGTMLLYAGWLVVSARYDDRLVGTVFAFVLYAELSAARTTGLWYLAQIAASLAVLFQWADPSSALPLLLLLALAGLVVATLRPRHASPAWALTCCWGAFAVVVVSTHAPPTRELDFAYASLAFAMFFAWIARSHLQRRRAVSGADLALVIANPAAYFTAAYELLSPEHAAYLGLLAVALAAANAVLAKLVWTPLPPNARDPRAGVLALGVAVSCFALAVPIQVSGFSITMAWALQAAGLVWLSARFESEKLGIAGTLLLALAACAVAADVESPREPRLADVREPAVPRDRGGRGELVRVGEVVRGSPAQARRVPRRAPAGARGRGARIAGWTTRAYAYNAFETTTVAISIWMALYAVALVAAGIVRKTVIDRVLGLALLGVVIVKLYVSDVWELGRAFRITAFLGLGGLLLLVSYVYSRYKSSLERLWKDDAGGES